MLESEQIVTIINQAKDAWMHGDAFGFASLFIDDGELIVPGKRWQGKEAIHDAFTEFTAKNLKVNIEIRRIFIAKDSAAVEWYWEETDNETKKKQPAEDVIVVDFENGYIRRWREYIDSQSLQ